MRDSFAAVKSEAGGQGVALPLLVPANGIFDKEGLGEVVKLLILNVKDYRLFRYCLYNVVDKSH